MSKAVRKVKPTRQGPNAERFGRSKPVDPAERKLSLRRLAKRLAPTNQSSRSKG